VQGEFLSLLKTGDVRALFVRYSDILLAILVAVIVGMMIVPLPTFVLDLFVTLNIAICGQPPAHRDLRQRGAAHRYLPVAATDYHLCFDWPSKCRPRV
jgi:hypothetical protein